MPSATNVWLIQLQSLKLAVSPHFEMHINVPGNMITQCEGNVSTVWHRDIIFDDCNKCNNSVTIIIINDI
jgi:hypothetical protein